MPPTVAPVLVVAVLAISSAAVLIKLAFLRGVGGLAIAFCRTSGVALLLGPVVLLRRAEDDAPAPGRRELGLIALGGASLAAHFGAWITSLELTTVLRSTVLVTLAPIWVGLIEWRVLRQPPRRPFWIGMAIAVVGASLLGVARGGAADGGGNLTGDALALLGGVFGAVYWLCGRAARRSLGIGTYAAGVSAVAALALLPVALGCGQLRPHAWDATTWAILAGLVLGAQLLGHNGFNYAMRYLPASLIATLTLLEPVGASLFAIAALGEVPTALEGLFGLTVVGGVISAAACGGAAPDSSSPPSG